MRAVLGAAALALVTMHAGPSRAQSGAAVETLAEKDVPASVTQRMRCKSTAGPMSRRPFAGGFVFFQSCTDGGDTLVRVVYATDPNGAGARLLQFHRPEGRRMSALASISFGDDQISGTTGRLTRRICRAEGRWRMEGKQPAPGLVYWRQTRDCEGKTGWQTVIGRRAE
jgi:hypothetical protein